MTVVLHDDTRPWSYMAAILWLHLVLIGLRNIKLKPYFLYYMFPTFISWMPVTHLLELLTHRCSRKARKYVEPITTYIHLTSLHNFGRVWQFPSFTSGVVRYVLHSNVHVTLVQKLSQGSIFLQLRSPRRIYWYLDSETSIHMDMTGSVKYAIQSLTHEICVSCGIWDMASNWLKAPSNDWLV